MKTPVAIPFLFFAAWAVCSAQNDVAASVSGASWTFQAAPDQFVGAQAGAQREVFQRTQQFQKSAAALAGKSAAVAADPIPQRNFIDSEIFSKPANQNGQPAGITADAEFFRRINLDLTGGLPSSADVRAFVANTDAGKRDAVIEQLLSSPQFNDKWTVWLGDLLQNNITQATAATIRQVDGRNTFYQYIYWSVAGAKSLHDVAYECLAMGGNNYNLSTGASNFIIGGSITGGSPQRHHHGMLVRSATAFLGMSHYDCLLCHNGAGHLDQLSVWGKQTTRVDAERMAAFFDRTRFNRYPAPTPPPGQDSPDHHSNSTSVADATAGGYDLSTNYGNRPNRVGYRRTVVVRIGGDRKSTRLNSSHT